MNAETLYRFCVREKQIEGQPARSKRLFITRYHLTEIEASERFEVVERLNHTALPATTFEIRQELH